MVIFFMLQSFDAKLKSYKQLRCFPQIIQAILPKNKLPKKPSCYGNILNTVKDLLNLKLSIFQLKQNFRFS